MNTRANIVLIHGAWAEGSCWGGVIERLQASGYQVTAPQFPLTALAGDVAPAAPGARSPRRSRIEVGTTDVMEVTWQRPPGEPPGPVGQNDDELSQQPGMQRKGESGE